MRYLISAVLLALLAGCATAQAEPGPEAYICADPQTRADKGGQQECEKFYAGLRGKPDACNGMNTLKCVKLLRGLEMAGFSPKS